MVRSLVLSPRDMRKTWLKLASLCRREDKLGMAERIIARLADDSHPTHPDVTFAECKLAWQRSDRNARDQPAIVLVEKLVKEKLEPQMHMLTDPVESAEVDLDFWHSSNNYRNTAATTDGQVLLEVGTVDGR